MRSIARSPRNARECIGSCGVPAWILLPGRSFDREGFPNSPCYFSFSAEQTSSGGQGFLISAVYRRVLRVDSYDGCPSWSIAIPPGKLLLQIAKTAAVTQDRHSLLHLSCRPVPFHGLVQQTFAVGLPSSPKAVCQRQGNLEGVFSKLPAEVRQTAAVVLCQEFGRLLSSLQAPERTDHSASGPVASVFALGRLASLSLAQSIERVCAKATSSHANRPLIFGRRMIADGRVCDAADPTESARETGR